MANSVRQSSTTARRLLAAVAVAATGLLAPLDAAAEIILDDFDDPFEIRLPEDIRFGYVVTQPNVGALGAERWCDVAAVYARPKGRADANISHVSSLTLEFDRLHATSVYPLVRQGLWYFLDETDVTQEGVNDRVVIDFAYLLSPISLARVDLSVQDASQPGNIYTSQLFGIPPGDKPFVLEFPFRSFVDSIGARSGEPRQIDYQHVYWVSVQIYPVFYAGPEEMVFSTAIERIRFTHAVPEPMSMIGLGLLAALVWLAAPRCLAVLGPHRLLATAILAAGVLLPFSRAHAEIILDDFDDPFEIVLPEMINRPYIMQSAVGPLSVERWSDVVAFSSRPTGRVNADLSRSSSLNVEIDRVNPTHDGFLPIIGLNFLYFFDEMDITQGGANDRVVADFAFLHSAIPLARVDVFVQDSTHPGVSYVSQLFQIPRRNEPFALEFPLDSFSERGGGAGKISFERVYRMSVGISPARFTDIDQIDFSTAIERIRITNTIPEPATSVLVCLCHFSVTWSLARKRRCSHEDQACSFARGRTFGLCLSGQ